MDLRSWIRDVPDFPKPGILFRDITPLLKDPRALEAAISAMAEKGSEWKPDLVAGIESRGFLFGTGVALRLGLGFIPVRKPGKLPWKTVKAAYALEYGTDAVEIHVDAAPPGARVLLVDDLLATGGTMRAACSLLDGSGAEVAGCLFLIELAALRGRDLLAGKRLHSLISY